MIGQCGTALIAAGLLLASASGLEAQKLRPLVPPEYEALPPEYLTALSSYRAGNLAGALASLNTLGEAGMLDVTRQLMRADVAEPRLWPRLMTAAILLHTEIFFVRAEARNIAVDDPFLISAHNLTRRLLKLAEDRQPFIGEDQRRFALEWYLLVIAYRHGRGDVGWSRAYIEEARKTFPREPRLALALGADHEMLSVLTAGYLRRFDTSGRLRREGYLDPEDELADSIRYFKEAASGAPESIEARLRLGRGLYQIGDMDGAAGELDAARALNGPPTVMYLVLLFRGMVETARGALDTADSLYAEAQALMPNAQSGVIARSEAAYLRGRSSEAASGIMTLLRREKKNDPWWLYIQGEWWHFEGRLARLRATVQE
jgi:tetratricopeptide (TPR) repeat protein